jgi:hypothetical protein
MESKGRQGFYVLVLSFAFAPLYAQCPGTPGLTVQEVSAEVTAGSVVDFADGNIARAPDATHFNSNHRAGHNAEFVNDGIYGDSNGIFFRANTPPTSGEVYVGILWDSAKTVREVAIGRDNLNHDQGGTDRAAGAYTFQYTTDTFTSSTSCGDETTSCNDSANVAVTWCSMGLADDHLNDTPLNSTRGARRRYTLPANLTGVTGVRVVTQVENVIDELEIGSSLGSLIVDPCPTASTPGLTFLPPASDELSINGVPDFGDGNLARAPDATFFNSPFRSGHDAEFINDGMYGDSNGIYFRHNGGGSASGEVYVGIQWSTPKTIREVALGRDSLNNDHGDRALGAYTFEYTTDVFTPVACPAEGAVCDDLANTDVQWCPLGLANAHGGEPQAAPTTRGARRLYTLPADLTGVTAVRVRSQLENVIDELEIGASAGSLDFDDPCPPEPSLQLVETGGPVTTPAFEEDVPTFADGNLARAADAVPFSTTYRAGHDASFINDGMYGDNSVIFFRGMQATSGQVYAGIYWSTGGKTVAEVALGRDNTGLATNLISSSYTFQYTTEDFTPVACDNLHDDGSVCDDSGNLVPLWCPMNVTTEHCPSPASGGNCIDVPDAELRRRYQLSTPLTDVRAVRVITTSPTGGLERIIDELEIFGEATVLEGGNLAGDCNQDGAVDLSDVICLLGFLFQNNPATLPCATVPANLNLMDCNGDGGIDLSDAIYKLAYLFQGDDPPVQGVNCFSIPGCPQNPGCP